MKAVILAAGFGSRLRPITDEIPKCMVDVNGIPIIQKQIENLLSNSINDIIVVSGYKDNILSEYLNTNFPFVNIIKNSIFDKTNNMYSLYLCTHFLKGYSFYLMNADVFFDANIITKMQNDKRGSLIACDNRIYMEESMKIEVDSEQLIKHISKQITAESAFAVSIDVYRFDEIIGTTLLEYTKHAIEELNDLNSWTEVAIDAICKTNVIYPHIINGRWFEIDNHNDLQEASKLFNK
jgi:choline kinase